MSLSVKCAGVVAAVAVTVIVSDRRPACKSAYIISKSAISFQNIFVYRNIICQNCVYITISAVNSIHKPIKICDFAYLIYIVFIFFRLLISAAVGTSFFFVVMFLFACVTRVVIGDAARCGIDRVCVGMSLRISVSTITAERLSPYKAALAR